jgi:hypothetical protein
MRTRPPGSFITWLDGQEATTMRLVTAAESDGGLPDRAVRALAPQRGIVHVAESPEKIYSFSYEGGIPWRVGHKITSGE